MNRQQTTTLAFAAIGATVLAFSLRLEPGSDLFVVSTLTLAAVWAVGAFAAGPLHLGRLVAPLAEGGDAVGKAVPPRGRGAFPLAPVLRGEGWGEGLRATGISTAQTIGRGGGIRPIVGPCRYSVGCAKAPYPGPRP